MGDAVIALLLRFERVLCNRRYNEEKLDCDRVEKESNMEFYKINIRFGFCKYMIGTRDISLKTFVPPLFSIIDFENILALRKNEMNNKLLFFKSMRYSYNKEVDEVTENLFKQNPCKFEEATEKELKERVFGLKKIGRYNSVTRANEIKHETIFEKFYRKTAHCTNNIKSLEKAFRDEQSVSFKNIFKKEFSIKQFADAIESLTAAMFLKCGLHGAQVFLKSISVLDNTKDYVSEFRSLVEELEQQEIEDYKSKIKNVEKIIGYKFKLKKLLLIALTHKSKYRPEQKKKTSFFNSYENLEFLGDAVHKFFVVKRLKIKCDEMLGQKHLDIGNEDVSSIEKTSKIIDNLNKKKTAAEANILLGFICIHSKIWEGIMV
jgi:dsRNA-specific ribonuclease